MSTQKFAVGERILLHCIEFPFYNGPQVVGTVLQVGGIYNDRIKGVKVRSMPPVTSSKYGYIMEAICEDEDGYEVVYDEMCLRKWPEPGTMDWEELMSTIEEPV